MTSNVAAPIDVVYVSDDGFADVLGVSMISLFESNRLAANVHVHIVNDGISNDNVVRLLSIGREYDRTVTFVAAPSLSDLVNAEIQRKNLPLTAYLRLFLGRLLPETVGRVLYLDCDTLVVGALSEVFETDLDGYCAGAVLDPTDPDLKPAIGLERTDEYFNSGVLLLNLDEMRREGVTDDFVAYIENCNGVIPVKNDQSVINATIARRTKRLDAAYNVTSLSFVLPYGAMTSYLRPLTYYSRDEYDAAIANPVVIHFTGNVVTGRPWVSGCAHPWAGEWTRLKDSSPWVGTPLRADSRSRTTRTMVWVFRHLPKGLAAPVARAAQRRPKSPAW